jgi:hypothetical protein
MAVGEGKFVLYSRIEPPLEAGEYRLTATQELTASGHTAADLPVAELPAHFTVRAPRFTLPPDQVLSTFPPAGSEGSYGSRLPQVVIRRRTLPWERSVQDGIPRSTPWLALVLVAEGEAELKLNVPVAQCATPGTALPGQADVELGNCLKIRKSMVDRIFPTRLDVPLLAHAREVDIHDTELMMGDDDGFLAVVIGNRLPLAGRGPDGKPVPVKYLACLVNLEGQFTQLLPKAPPHESVTSVPSKLAEVHADAALWDHTKMGRMPYGTDVGDYHGPPHGGGDDPVPFEPGPFDRLPKAPSQPPTTGAITAVPSSGTAAAASTQQSGWSGATVRSGADVYAEMAADFSEAVVSGFVVGSVVAVDPTLTFPVLLHWSFTSFGSVTFRSLVEGLDSGLLGTVGEEPVTGRPPLEVVETGHTGLEHRTRRGDPVRSWYRGPFVPHPTTAARLPLAHAADQLRIVVPDGREDISLASAFEIGRLLALARPSMIAALMRWRQTGYQQARRGALWSELNEFLDNVLGPKQERFVDPRIGVELGRALVEAVLKKPDDFVGDPSPLVTAGLPVAVDGTPAELLATGFGLPAEVFKGDVLANLRAAPVLGPEQPVVARDAAVREVLGVTLEAQMTQLVLDTFALDLQGQRMPKAHDALDRLIGGDR